MNRSDMFGTSSKLQRAQRVHVACVVWWLVNVAVSEVMNIHKRRAPFVIGACNSNYIYVCEVRENMTSQIIPG